MTKNEKLFMEECNFPKIRKLWKPKFRDKFVDSECEEVRTIHEIFIDLEDEKRKYLMTVYYITKGGYKGTKTVDRKNHNFIWLPSLSQIIAEIEKFPNYVEWWAGEWIKGKSYYFCIARKQGKPIEKVSLTIKLAAIKALKQVLKGER